MAYSYLNYFYLSTKETSVLFPILKIIHYATTKFLHKKQSIQRGVSCSRLYLLLTMSVT